MQQKRRLIIIPIVHTQADFGRLGNKVPVDQEYETMTTQYWQAVSGYVQRLSVDFSELRVYQDGLPDISAEMVTKIVEETQTPNYELLRWLRNKGAYIMGTEDPPFCYKNTAPCKLFLMPKVKNKNRQRWNTRR